MKKGLLVALSLTILFTISFYMPISSSTDKSDGWGPERPTYTMESLPTTATFNSVTNNPVIGDERDFVRIAERNSGEVYTNEIKLIPGKEYEIYIGYHNDAASSSNETGAGIAQQVRLSSTFPNTLYHGTTGSIDAVISAYGTSPEKVWDGVKISSDVDIEISYKAGSAVIYNGWGINESVLSDELFTENGTYLGVDKLDGIVFGSEDYSGYVIYIITVEEIN